MRVVLYPYFSQQCKVAQKFRLDSDSCVAFYADLQKRMHAVGWQTTFVLPQADQCTGSVDAANVERMPRASLSNLDRRFEWNPSWLRYIADGADVVVTGHETLPIPLKHLTQAKVVCDCEYTPGPYFTEAMFKFAWHHSDLVYCNSRMLCNIVGANATLWENAYDSRIADKPARMRDVDVLFNARASVTNYSNHDAFLHAFSGSSLNVVMTNPTQWLKHPLALDCQLSREEYVDLLHRSRVVVALLNNFYGGYAWREAFACGAVPVALKLPEYVDVLGRDWPFYCKLDNVADVVHRALSEKLDKRVLKRALDRNARGSYDNCWLCVKRDLEKLCAT